MKKIGLVTLYGLTNYGNKLQNYATQVIFLKYGYLVDTLIETKEKKTNITLGIRIALKTIIKNEYKTLYHEKKRAIQFFEFDKNINKKILIANNFFDIKNEYTYFAIGSDQVWNPCCIENIDLSFLTFCDADKKITISPSIGVSSLNKEEEILYSKYLNSFRNISCREDDGANIISKLTNKTVPVLVDPTMMLTKKEWDLIIKKPVFHKNDKYILTYFLGDFNENSKRQIDKLKKEGYFLINLMDKKNIYYTCGPSEFVWLIKNASLMITDSFHGCVFSILYKTPFIVYDRKSTINMNSRINTLLNKFHFEDRYFLNNENIEDLFNQNFSEVDNILLYERKKFSDFIEKTIII